MQLVSKNTHPQDPSASVQNFDVSDLRSLAQFERRLIQERTRAGLESARARGRLGGRKPMLIDDPRVQTAKTLHADRKMPVADICATLKISRATLYRYVG